MTANRRITTRRKLIRLVWEALDRDSQVLSHGRMAMRSFDHGKWWDTELDKIPTIRLISMVPTALRQLYDFSVLEHDSAA